MTAVGVLGSVNEPTDGTGGAVDTVVGAAIGPYRKTRLIRMIPRASTLLGRIPEVPLAWPGTSSDNMTNNAQLQEVIDRANAEKARLKR